ncbi:uncharacterized protein [Rutidosis leptorrhynchoides]|uniref:uncharacterized protein n=1 Tax=Rutidosis leptorrhynchoides TaxID=125765 RepID=UPI003A99A113
MKSIEDCAWSSFGVYVNIDLTHTYRHLRSCPPSLGVGRPRRVRGGSGVATLGRIRVGSWNIGTLTGKRIELVDSFLKSNVDIGCVQETRWKGEGVVDIKDYRLWYSSSRIARNGVGIFLGNLHKDNVVDVGRFSDRIMSVSLIIKEEIFTVISAYAPHASLSDAKKKRAEAEGYEGAHGALGLVLETKKGAQFLSLPLPTRELRTCRDCKVIPALMCSSQHRLLVMDLVTRGRVGRRARVVQHRILWKNLHGAKAETFRATVTDRLSVEGDNVAPTDVDQIWNCMALRCQNKL